MTWAEHSLRSPGRGKPTRGPSKHSGAQGTGCWHCPMLGRPWDMAVDTVRLSSHAPDMQARHLKDWAPPSHISSSFPLPGERQLLLSEFLQPPLPAHLPEIINPWLLAQVPAHPARDGLCLPSRGHSGMRHQLDTNSNLAGRANSGHPRGLLKLRS